MSKSKRRESPKAALMVALLAGLNTSAQAQAIEDDLAPAIEPAAPAAPESRRTLDDVSVNAFGDAFYLVDWNRPDRPSAPSDVAHRAFDHAAGFGLAFAGLDVRYAREHFGVTLDLRFGEGAARLIGNDTPVLGNVKQAFVSYMPTSSVSIDFGQFDTLYGAEVADSWRNLNYTRGALYYLMQPFYHTGLRASWQATRGLRLTGMVVNGTNNPIDGNVSPHVGLQASVQPSSGFGVSLGYYAGAGSSGFGDASEPTSNDDWEHFVDVVLTAGNERVSFVGNLDVYASGPDSGVNEGRSMYWGGSAALGVVALEELRFGLRGEILQDPDGFIGDGWEWLATGTFTIDVRPVPNVILRLDNRIEAADLAVFAGADGPATRKTWFATTLGVVVTSDP